MGRMINVEAHKLRVIERINNEDEVSFFDAVWIANTFFEKDTCANPVELITGKVINMSNEEFEAFCTVLKCLREVKELVSVVNKA